MNQLPLLEITKLGYQTPKGRMLQDNISFKIKAGQLGLIMGPNGCGKSTLLKVLLGEHPILSGNILWKIPMKQVAYLAQLENVQQHLPITLGDLLGIACDEQIKKNILFSDLDSSWFDKPWNRASGGERKRCLVARALLQEPKFLILDEPLNHLDTASRAHIIKALHQALSFGMGVIMVSHLGLDDEQVNGIDILPLILNEKA